MTMYCTVYNVVSCEKFERIFNSTEVLIHYITNNIEHLFTIL